MQPPSAEPTQPPSTPPIRTPTQAPMPMQPPSPKPTLAPTRIEPVGDCVPEDDCSKNTLCSVDWTIYCQSLRSTCPTPYCKRSGATAPAPATVPTPAPSASRRRPSSIPSSCVPEDDCTKNTFCTMDWTTYCRAAASVCPTPFCKKRPSLSQAASVQRHLRSSSHVLQPDAGSSLIQQQQQLNMTLEAVEEPEVQHSEL